MKTKARENQEWVREVRVPDNLGLRWIRPFARDANVFTLDIILTDLVVGVGPERDRKEYLHCAPYGDPLRDSEVMADKILAGFFLYDSDDYPFAFFTLTALDDEEGVDVSFLSSRELSHTERITLHRVFRQLPGVLARAYPFIRVAFAEALAEDGDGMENWFRALGAKEGVKFTRTDQKGHPERFILWIWDRKDLDI